MKQKITDYLDEIYGGTFTATHLQKLVTWLQSIFSHVHLLPFYPWSSDDGFSVIDYHQVASEAGEWQDIQ